MTYTGRECLDLGIITDEELMGKISPCGYDLSVKKLEKITSVAEESKCTLFPEEDKIIYLDENSKIHNISYIPCEEDSQGRYVLQPYTQYAVEMDQGIDLKENQYARIIGRSSLNRAGVQVLGVVFDPNFRTDTIGCTIYTGSNVIIIPKHTRIAQAQVYTCNTVLSEDLYNGRWQNKANY